MTSSCKVVGIIQASNEYPLLGLSISHALMYHVDEIYVLNHACHDGTQEGIKSLQELWKGRIFAYDYYDENFYQEASTNVMIEISRKSLPDWIWVFDADEFMLTRENKPLKHILDEVDPKYALVRYEVRNWISREDFDETSLENYEKLCHRTVPRQFFGMPAELMVDEVLSGNLNFYDFQFPSKAIFRNNLDAWLGAGAHRLKHPDAVETLHLEIEELSLAHFPLLTRKRLDSRAQQGKKLMQAGFPLNHGWQSQMIFKFMENCRLDEFWRSHSVGPSEWPDRAGAPSIVADDSFFRSIAPVVSLLKDKFGERMPSEGSGLRKRFSMEDDTRIPLGVSVSLTRKFQMIADSACRDREHLEEILSSRSWQLVSKFRNFALDHPRLVRLLQRIQDRTWKR
jgi:hypothetical protein